MRHCEKKLHMNMYLLLNGYRDTVVWIYCVNLIFAHELQSALRLTVGFSKIFFEL
jgi:hypothetical protein